MNRDPIDDLLDGLTPLPDQGFTRRVMAALPPARSEARPLERWLPPLAAGLAAAVLAPEAGWLGQALADGSTRLAGELARAAAAGGGALPLDAGVVAVALALGAAALGSWLVAEPS